MDLHGCSSRAIEQGATFDAVQGLPVREDIARAKFQPESEVGAFDEIEEKLQSQIRGIEIAGADASVSS